jgi:hypothetical protein
MSLHEYEVSLNISARDYPFYALIMAAFRKADSDNLGKLRCAFPLTWNEFIERYNAPGGLLEGELPKTPCPDTSGWLEDEGVCIREEELPETIMGMSVKVVATVGESNPPTLVLGSFNDYDHEEI